MEYFSHAGEALEAFLAIVGGFKIFARYTPWKWDDKAFDYAERYAKKAASWFPKKKK